MRQTKKQPKAAQPTGSKKDEVLALLQQLGGATLVSRNHHRDKLAIAQRPRVPQRNLRKKLNLNVQLLKRDDGEKAYTVA